MTERRLTHPDDPKLNEHVAGSISPQTRQGWCVGKAPGRNNETVVALLMALERVEHVPPPVEVLAWIG